MRTSKLAAAGLALPLLAVLLLPAQVAAQNPSTVAPPTTSSATERRLEELEREVRALRAEKGAPDADETSDESDAAPSRLEQVSRDLDLYGGVVTSYVYNLANPPGRKGKNPIRASDLDHNTVNANLFELGLTRPLSGRAEWDLGFKVDLHAGRSVEDILSIDPEILGGEEINLGNAYISLQLPTAIPIEIWFGQAYGWFTVESPDLHANSLFTLSYFASFTPYLNTGLFARVTLAKGLSYMQYVGNGSEVMVDNNDAKTVGGQLLYEASPDLWVAFNWLFGAERTGNTHDHRTQLEIDAGWTIAGSTSLALMLMYGVEEGADVRNGHAAKFGGASMQIRQGLARIEPEGGDAFDRFALIGRATIFRDQGGANSGLSQTLTELTAALELKPASYGFIRAEYRLDLSTDRPFLGRQGRATRHAQSTLGLIAGVSF